MGILAGIILLIVVLWLFFCAFGWSLFKAASEADKRDEEIRTKEDRDERVD